MGFSDACLIYDPIPRSLRFIRLQVTQELILGKELSIDICRLKVEKFEEMGIEEEGGVVG